MFRLFLTLPVMLSACLKDETVSGYAVPGVTYALTEMNGRPFAAHATIAFPSEGQVTGEGPCNSFFASQSAPYPWFSLGPIAATRSVCADAALERAYFAALARMATAEVSGPLLVLQGASGEELVFRAN